MAAERILITGANGQIGTVLSAALRKEYGAEAVINSDIREPSVDDPAFELLNVLDQEGFHNLVQKYNITQVYHLAAILSAAGEQNPLGTWRINMEGLMTVLELARNTKVKKVFFPSSIAVFGPRSPGTDTPQNALRDPTTVYGISKVAGENWCQYYFNHYGVDVRSLRYPGIIGYESLPGGGTTDYAVDIFHKAVQKEPFRCFLKSDARLPMIYMPDAIRATIALMEAPASAISIRSSYNLSGMDFTPAEIAAALQQEDPEFSISYVPDFRQEIAESWPGSINDDQARKDWAWKPAYDLSSMTIDMLKNLKRMYQSKV